MLGEENSTSSVGAREDVDAAGCSPVGGSVRWPRRTSSTTERLTESALCRLICEPGNRCSELNVVDEIGEELDSLGLGVMVIQDHPRFKNVQYVSEH